MLKYISMPKMEMLISRVQHQQIEILCSAWREMQYNQSANLQMPQGNSGFYSWLVLDLFK